MTVRAFTGGAGCGKTYQLMRSLTDYLETTPLKDGQKILALTFMHGSRRRLEERLGLVKAVRGRTDCSTIDSFASRLIGRWSSLADALGFANIEPDQYERVCDAAAALLKRKEVCSWVEATFPILILDEAQDLTANRLGIVEGLAGSLEVFAAADEFQCLNEELRPNPACAWLTKVCAVEELIQPRRTTVSELLEAAAAIRNGTAPKSEKAFMVELTPKSHLAGAWINGNLKYYGGNNSVAVITPTFGKFTQDALVWAAENVTSKGAGPYKIFWEESEAKAVTNFLQTLVIAERNDIPSVIALLTAAGDFRTLKDVSDWMDTQRRARAQTLFSKSEIESAIKKNYSQRRRTQKHGDTGWHGMTVHGAKNREFDNVIVLWPAAIGGSDDQKRRLLYNAVTRAKKRCLVLVQAKSMLFQAPFA